MATRMTNRIEREKEFHDQEFSENARVVVEKFYSIARTSRNYYLNTLLTNCKGKKVLEYGCGPGTYTCQLAQNGAFVTAIDISSVAIEKARAQAHERGFSEHTSFHVMNAEELDFPENHFDIICGVSILHHLNLPSAMQQVSRVLKDSGTALFIEPLGHNFLINTYRALTPHLRSEDEHPLLKNDLKLISSFFNENRIAYFHLSSLLAVYFRNTRFFEKMLSACDSLDRLLFLLPFLRLQAWQIVIELSHPKTT